MLRLTYGAASVVIAPECGGGIVGWMQGTTPVLRRALPQTIIGGNPHTLGCFPLLPYCNRIGQRRFAWAAAEHRLWPNFGDNPHNIHGLGWQRRWTVGDLQSDAVRLTLDHRPDAGWPFAFRATLDYSLSAHGLSVGMALRNTHDSAAPAGIGLHPHFPKVPGAALRFVASGAWRNGDDGLPVTHGPVPDGWSHAAPRPVEQSRLDHCFTGWDGLADISAGSASLRIEATGVFRCLQVFTPSWADFFCAEPVSHVPDALNLAGLPQDQAMTRLEPGGSLAGTVRFLVSQPEPAMPARA